MIPVKICGLSTPETVAAAVIGGAQFVGFVLYPPSPRAVSPEAAGRLAAALPAGVRSVGLFVDPTDGALQSALGPFHPDLIQLHGREDPARVAQIRRSIGRPVIKAIAVAAADDILNARPYEDVADWILFDAKPAAGSLPGGGGRPFDWSLLQTYRGVKPWMLSGGLTADNVGEALSRLKPDALDLSSGVETAPGQKDPRLIRDFLKIVAGCTSISGLGR